MNLREFRSALAANSDKHLEFQFATGETLAVHFHVTEIGKVTKDFVDCGGTRRTTESCMLQTLVANDTDHRLTAGKLSGILEKASALGLDEEVAVEAEVQGETIGIYSVEGVAEPSNNGTLQFQLAAKQTACLAPDKCKLDALPVLGTSDGDCCGETGCC